MKTIAFLGLGNMGSAMAERLLATGYVLRVFNRTAARTETLVRQGAQAFASPAQACAGADVIICMVADDTASRAIWYAADGALANALKPGAIAIECSTVSHGWVQELATRARLHGLRYIDAPVTGLPQAAAAGTLTMLVGADTADLAAARGPLEALAGRIYHFGAVGTGTAYKLIVNLLGAVQIASAAEALAIAERAGLNLPLVCEAIASGQAASPQVVRNTRRMIADDHQDNVIFTAQLRLKDVEYALGLSQSLGIGAPFGSLAATAFRQLCELGLQEVNESAVLKSRDVRPSATSCR